MKNKNVITLKDIDWDKTNYLLKYIKDDTDYLEITLGDFSAKSGKQDLIILFDCIVDSYLISKKKYHPKFFEMDKKDKSFYFEVKDSEYLRWVMEESSPYGLDYSKDLGFKHYVFLFGSIVLDVISNFEPEVKFK